MANTVISREPFGQLADGRPVERFTLQAEGGIRVRILSLGGIIASLEVPNERGEYIHTVLGFGELSPYLRKHPYFSVVVGRFANRIAFGRFEIDGKVYQLDQNNGEHHLHGGDQFGFGLVLWKADIENGDTLRLEYHSMDGEEGYPGNLTTVVRYSLPQKNNLRVSYEATTDRATHVNFTVHPYFNLSGDFNTTILDHELTLFSDQYTPSDHGQIPTGEIVSVEGTPFDFRTPKSVDRDIAKVSGVFDHNFVVRGNKGDFRKAAELRHPETGRSMEVFTTEPGVHFYAGSSLEGNFTGYGGAVYRKYAGLCLETQHYPDSPNKPQFPSTLLKPGEVFESATEYRFL